jgi:hypothetical protein
MFEKNVFINCPFDEDYVQLLRPLLFTILFLGFTPQLASQRSDAGEARIEKICKLIAGSKYGIHDLSRIRAENPGDFFRLNMPFELGIEYGCRRFSNGQLSEKKLLVLETERYRYMKALSDLSGSDIKSHNNDPQKNVFAVRSWFVETAGLQGIKSATSIWYAFNEFMSDFYDTRVAAGFEDDDLNMMPVPEFVQSIQSWLEQ